MAEMTVSSTANTTNGRPRPSTKVDLTPMVDLGFLLITFFMLTTALNKPNVMALVMPDRENISDPPSLTERKALTLLLGDQDKIYWYVGLTDAHLDSTDYSSAGIQKVILDCMDKLEKDLGTETYEDLKTHAIKQGSFLNVLIKPMNTSRYKNVVDVLDEMAICRVRRYMILSISPEEEAFVKNPSLGLVFSVKNQKKAVSKER
jgi:biopolymer transport protein ExbD